MRPCVPEMDNLIGKYFPVLDHGFISLVDYMGDESSIEQAARVSYGQGTRKTSDRVNLLRYLMSHRHCYDDQTEVLTGEGFKLWQEVTSLDVLGCWDEEKKSLVYEKPEYLTADEYNGKMYRVEHGGIDLLVTPEHSMYVKKKKSVNNKMIWEEHYSLRRAIDIDLSSMIRYCKIAPLIELEECSSSVFGYDKKAFCRFIGFFIGDGTPYGKYDTDFHLKKQRKIDYLKRLAGDLGLSVQENASDHYIVKFHSLPENYFRSFYKNGEKCIPLQFKKLFKSHSLALLDGLKNSDGSIKRGTWTYSTAYKQLAEEVQILALHAGEAAHICKKHNGIYDVSILSRMREPIINQGKRNTSWVNYSGKVYCAKTRTGILVVRRNGKICLSGNTTPYEMAEIKFHIGMPIFVARQLIRHRTFSVNEYSGRYSVMPALFYTPKRENLAGQSIENKQGRQDGLLYDETQYDDYNIDIESLRSHATNMYKENLKDGMAKELARIDLPLSMYTYWYFKVDLHNFLHMLSLRADSHAQWEIREYANVMMGIMKQWMPNVFQAFLDYRMNACSFSALEMEVIREIESLSHSIASENLDTIIDELLRGRISVRERVALKQKITSQPKYNPDYFNLDLSKARDSSYYEELVKNAAVEVPL